MKIIPAEAMIHITTRLPLNRVPCIHHLLWVKKDQAKVQVLLDSSNDVNSMTLAYAANLSLKVWSTNVEAQKINGFTFKTFGIVLTNF